MKECPNCRKVYSDDLFFCLDDGSPLRQIGGYVDPNAATEAAIDVSSSLRTEVIPISVPKTQVVPHYSMPQPKSHSKLLYVVIAVLTLACLTLVAAMIAINRDRIFTTQESATNTTSGSKSIASPTPALAAASSPMSSPRSASTPVTQPAASFNPTGRWKGEWSTASGTLFDFELNLSDTGGDNLEGQIRWTMRRTARPDKTDKIGLSATEFVRGNADQATRTINLTGYAKDDPGGVLVMLDVYKLNISADGKSLIGAARNGGKWNGRVRLSR